MYREGVLLIIVSKKNIRNLIGKEGRNKYNILYFTCKNIRPRYELGPGKRVKTKTNGGNTTALKIERLF